MRILVCGGRNFADRRLAFNALDVVHARTPIRMIIEGGAKGADTFAREWAGERKIAVWTFCAEWGKYGKAAGPMRNQKMLDDGQPDMVIALPGGKGTRGMMLLARTAGVNVWPVQKWDEK